LPAEATISQRTSTPTRFRGQLHIELYNAFNDVFFNNPNLNPTSADFGKVSSQNNLPRNIQIGTKFLF
jgi:hypothetical protein